jgi:HEPN domain-containing protein
VSPFDSAEHDRWLAAAEDAASAAALQASGGGHNWSCFLAEQAAQLAVKGLLHGMGAGAWGHDRVVLGRELGKQMKTALPADVEAALRRLSRHYIPARYPDAHPTGPPSNYYGSEDSEQAMTDYRTIREFLASARSALDSAPPERSS